jgi:hypothetical protein
MKTLAALVSLVLFSVVAVAGDKPEAYLTNIQGFVHALKQGAHATGRRFPKDLPDGRHIVWVEYKTAEGGIVLLSLGPEGEARERL